MAPGQGVVRVYLRQSCGNNWALYAEKGHQISPAFIGDLRSVYNQARAWASTWPNWSVVVEEEDD